MLLRDGGREEQQAEEDGDLRGRHPRSHAPAPGAMAELGGKGGVRIIQHGHRHFSRGLQRQGAQHQTSAGLSNRLAASVP